MSTVPLLSEEKPYLCGQAPTEKDMRELLKMSLEVDQSAPGKQRPQCLTHPPENTLVSGLWRFET